MNRLMYSSPRLSFFVVLSALFLISSCSSSQAARKDGRSLTVSKKALYPSRAGLPPGVVTQFGESAFRGASTLGCIATHRNADFLALCDNTSQLKLMDKRFGARTFSLGATRANSRNDRYAPFVKASYTASGRYLVTRMLGSRKTLGIWKMPERRSIKQLAGYYNTSNYIFATHPTKDVVAYVESNLVRVYDITVGKEIRSWPLSSLNRRRRNATVRHMAWSPDGTSMVIVHNDGFVVYNPEQATILARHDLSYSGYQDAAFSPDSQTLAMGNRAGDIELWSLKPLKKKKTLYTNDLGGRIEQLMFLNGGKQLIGVEARYREASRVSVWNVDGEELQPVRQVAGRIIARTEKQDEILIGAGPVVRRYALSTLTPVKVGQGHVFRVSSLAWSPGDKTLWSTSLDGSVFSWNLQGSGKSLRTGFLPGDIVLTTSPARKTIALFGSFHKSKTDGEEKQPKIEQKRREKNTETAIQILDTSGESPREVRRFAVKQKLRHLSLDARKGILHGLDSSGSMHTYHIGLQKRVAMKPYGHKFDTELLTASPDFSTIVVHDKPYSRYGGRKTPILRVWDGKADKLLFQREGRRAGKIQCGVSPDQSLIACNRLDSNIEVYDREGNVQYTIDSKFRYIYLVSFTPDSKGLLVVGGQQFGRKITADFKAIRLKDGRTTHKIAKLPVRPSTVMMHPDKRRLLLGYRDGLIHAWNLSMFEIPEPKDPKDTKDLKAISDKAKKI